LICILITYKYFRSFAAAASFARGDEVFLEEASQELGVVREGEKRTIDFRLRNLTSQPIKILDSRMSCSCTSAQMLPESMLPGQITLVHIAFDPPASKRGQRVTELVKLFTSSSQVELNMSFSAMIEEPSHSK